MKLKDKRIGIIIMIFFMLLYTACSKIEKNNKVPQGLKLKALENLHIALEKSSKWEKVHTAEALINLGFSEEAYRIFKEEERQKREEYFYRIGIWRVLAQAALKQEEKKQWTDSILNVFKNTKNPDIIHSAETLAKLSYSPSYFDEKLTDSILNDKHNALWACTLWASAYTPDKEDVKKQLVTVIQNKNELKDVRKLAAYALRFLKDVRVQDRELLIDVLNKEPDSSNVYPYLLSAILVNTPKDSLLSKQTLSYKNKLETISNSNGNFGQYEVLSALAEIGNIKDIKLLSTLLKSIDTVELTNKTDIKVAISYAILKIDQRQKMYAEIP